MKNSVEDLAQRLLEKELNRLNAEERAVLDGMREGRSVSRDAMQMAEEEASLGDRVADRVAAIGGSWAFIIVFGVVLLSWMLLNSDVLSHWNAAFDPYPYIFLNLMLSMLAAIQAPVILMSQNRQADKDRVAARLDYRVNLRAELEILRLHEKVDTMIADGINAILTRQDRMMAIVEHRSANGANK
jgi:uncharacterized membrane protein